MANSKSKHTRLKTLRKQQHKARIKRAKEAKKAQAK